MKYTHGLLAFLGFFIFSAPSKAQIEIPCGTFPAVAQSHTSSVEGWLAVYGTSYIQQKTNNFQPLVLGFTDQLATHPNSCNNGATQAVCQTDTKKIVPALPSWPIYQELGDLSVLNKETVLGEKGECKTLDPAKCSYRNLNITNGTLTLHPGTYWFNDILFSDISRLKITGTGTVRLYVGTINVNRASSIDTTGISPNNFLMMINGDGSFSGSSHFNAHIYAKGSVILADSVKLTGAITSKNLRLSHDFVQLVGQSRCFSERTFQLELTPTQMKSNICSRIPLIFNVKDDQGYLQTDVTGSVIAKIKNAGKGCWSTTQIGGECTPTNKSIPLTNGSATLWLEHNEGGDVNVTASFHSPLTQDLIPKKDGSYRFLPSGFMFSYPSTNVIAGKEVKLTIEALNKSCQSNRALQSYEGEKWLKIGETNYIEPAFSGPAPIKPIVNKTNRPQTIKVNFTKGVAKDALSVIYRDAGTIAISITDVTPIPAALNINPPDVPPQENPPLSGQAILTFRPYTFAICPLNVNKGPSTATDVFTVAGMPFSLILKPVVWMRGDQDNALPVNLNNDFCNENIRAITPSFSHLKATSATVKLNNTAILLSPFGGQNGLLSSSNSLEKPNTISVNGVYEFNILRLDEVGSFSVTSGLAQKYLGMTVNPGVLSLGRFYPSYFDVSSTLKSGVPPEQDTQKTGFTYLEQPFALEYSVRAMTINGVAVKNYHLFTGETASFNDWVINPNIGTYPYSGLDLTERWKPLTTGSWSSSATGNSEFRIIENKMIIEKQSQADGPFSLRFAVGINNKDIDGTDFKFCDNETQLQCAKKVVNPQNNGMVGAQFAKEDFLFARMNLTGFTETLDFTRPQKIIVSIEHFNEGRYLLNTRDNYSMISTDKGFANKKVLHSDTTNPLEQAQISLEDGTQGSKSVIKGSAVYAVNLPSQAGGAKNKEQFLFTLMLGEQKSASLRQPWLRHNWQGATFIENPSAIGTYGFYRGSDRIIYRGEKNTVLARE